MHCSTGGDSFPIYLFPKYHTNRYEVRTATLSDATPIKFRGSSLGCTKECRKVCVEQQAAISTTSSKNEPGRWQTVAFFKIISFEAYFCVTCARKKIVKIQITEKKYRELGRLAG
jgi:hypothetical protein